MPDAAKPKLFINHATEDKASFVEPLVAVLESRKFPIWYDKDDIAGGNALLATVNKGLVEADYGISVFSKAYFAKNWTTDELDGLYALETKTRKVIIPVWLNVTFDDVKAVYPMLAARKAIDASLGVEQVADEIEVALGLAERIKSLTPFESLKAEVQRIADVTAADAYNIELAAKPLGAEIVRKTAKTSFETVSSIVAEFASRQQGWKVNVNQVGPSSNLRLIVGCPFDIIGCLDIFGIAINGIHNCSLKIEVLRIPLDAFGREVLSSKTTLSRVELKPYIVSENAIQWYQGEENVSGEALAEYFLGILVNHVKTVAGKTKRPSGML